jgi:hypothetical protein
MPRHLGWLAGCSRTCSCAAVFPYFRPHKPLGHQLDCGAGPGVAKAMEGVKNLASERRYGWPRLRSGCVTVKVDVRTGDVHPFQPKR